LAAREVQRRAQLQELQQWMQSVLRVAQVQESQQAWQQLAQV